MQKTYDLYKRGLAHWYLLLIPLIGFGFYKTYFSVILDPTPSVIHIHFILMLTWAIMLIVQPFLIRYKKYKFHRIIGKISYVVIPLLLISGYFVLRYAYGRIFNATAENVKLGRIQMNPSEILQRSADGVRIVILYLCWLGLFYFLAIKNRRITSVHARYMVAASLTMIGPTLERIVGIYFHVEKIFNTIPLEYMSFVIQDLILAGLLVYDIKKNKPANTLRNCLTIYLAGQLLFWFAEHKPFWQSFVSFIVQNNS